MINNEQWCRRRHFSCSDHCVVAATVFLMMGMYYWGFPGGSEGKVSACNAGDLGLIPDWEDPLEKEIAIHSSTLAWKNPMDREAWWATVHGVTKSRTRLSNFTSLHFISSGTCDMGKWRQRLWYDNFTLNIKRRCKEASGAMVQKGKTMEEK